jgi:hypothetical protein
VAAAVAVAVGSHLRGERVFGCTDHGEALLVVRNGVII